MNNTTKNNTSAPEPYVRRIGSTAYTVRIHYNSKAKETLDEKIRRLLTFELQSAAENAIMEPLQAEWLSERKVI